MTRFSFRAWHKGIVQHGKEIVKPQMLYDTWPGECLKFLQEKQDIEVMQSTGLFDVNGTEIFEGDVYEAEGMSPTVVIFEDGVFRGKGSQMEGLWYDIETYGPLTILGNIYESPNWNHTLVK
jgi:uncharacterized phage protein (TIGR01671 family)